MIKPNRSHIAGLKLMSHVFAYNLAPGAAPSTAAGNLLESAEQSTDGGDAIEELRAIANYIRETGVLLPADENADPADHSLALVLERIEKRIQALSAIPNTPLR